MLRSVAGRLFLSYLGVVAVGLLVAAITISGLFVRYENDVLRLRLQELSAPLLTAMQTALRNGQQPRLRCARDAIDGPFGERGSECLGQRVLGARKIARARGEERDELAIAAPRYGFGCFAYAQTGRTSIAPCAATGFRVAHESAASRSATSIRK